VCADLGVKYRTRFFHPEAPRAPMTKRPASCCQSLVQSPLTKGHQSYCALLDLVLQNTDVIGDLPLRRFSTILLSDIGRCHFEKCLAATRALKESLHQAAQRLPPRSVDEGCLSYRPFVVQEYNLLSGPERATSTCAISAISYELGARNGKQTILWMRLLSLPFFQPERETPERVLL
jgi:hypothetical protein